MKVRFGHFTLDGETRQLLRGECEVGLSPKAFDLLQILVETRPRAVSKAELQERLWPSAFVSEGNLPNLISEIRGALDDTARGTGFVRTVHRYGYAFSGAAALVDADLGGAATADLQPPSSPKTVVNYWLAWEKLSIPLGEGVNIVGREPGVSVWFDLPSVSRRHARILIEDGHVSVEDLGSKNGTWVGSQLVTSPVSLADGDEIRIGSVSVVFRAWTPDVTETVLRSRVVTGSARRASSQRR
jgi:DNA-binding winged helix-turn-helix (wHTH) protein